MIRKEENPPFQTMSKGLESCIQLWDVICTKQFSTKRERNRKVWGTEAEMLLYV